MKHILSISYSQEHYNFDEIIDFGGEKIRLTQYSTDFDLDLAEELIIKHDGIVDVICLAGLPPVLKYKGGVFTHPQLLKLKQAAKKTPIVDGQVLKEIYLPWAFRQFYLKNSHLLSHQKVAFYSGAIQKSLLEVMEEFDNQILLADPYFYSKLPFVLKSSQALESFIKYLGPVLKKITLKRSQEAMFNKDAIDLSYGLREFFQADIFVGNEMTFQMIDRKHLKGKIVMTDFMGPKLEKLLREAQVKQAIVCMPRVINHRFVNFAILEGVFQAFNSFDKGALTVDSVLSWIEELELRPAINQMNTQFDYGREVCSSTTFAFIVHPLNVHHVFKHSLLKGFRPYSHWLGRPAERFVSLFPGFYYGKIRGIRSEKNGRAVEGLIYTVTETPRMLLDRSPEVIYHKLIRLCEKAFQQGAGIIGLGAYTKIVGDGGMTVAKASPIPVTTGNSLSACATLWAAKLALEKMNLVKKVKGQYKGRVMVVGATGSIGAVCAKILAGEWREIVLVAPRAYRLLELKEEILEIHPKAKIIVATTPDDHSGDCDLIITTTSSRGKKILSIEDVKPGCVICDVSRPFDIRLEEAIKRPDVMVIASGEVILPGEVQMKLDIGLEGNIVYACLAETALLAMEGRLESFTLSRNIHYEKVLEIDKMAQEHGVRLSAIMGHNGFVSDHEFELCRKHALKALKERDGQK